MAHAHGTRKGCLTRACVGHMHADRKNDKIKDYEHKVRVRPLHTDDSDREPSENQASEKEGEAEIEEEDEVPPEDKIPTHIIMTTSDRTWGNFILYLLYKVFRIFYTSVWSYFLPFVAMIRSYAVPYYACR